MSNEPVKKIKDDYPPLDSSIKEKDYADYNEADEEANAAINDKQPAGDAGPEDAIPPKPNKPETKY
ncbi:MAG: hypothetical protein H0V30_10575 [Chitinophagaceae bacterium]|jgi:hypothetical protein|nr:hypothetical protein [Chitinophagaceae bacterium]